MRLLIFLVIISMGACNKWEDKPGPTDDRLKRPYCNDPEAVNYNWDFPGTEDSTVCYYPADLFEGDFIMRDSVYNDNNDLVDTVSKAVRFNKLSNTKLELTQLCTQPINISATRNFSASIDTVIYHGQLLCNQTDTASALIIQKHKDTLSFQMNVWGSDGLLIHRGLFTR